MNLLFQFFSVKINRRDIAPFALGGIVEERIGDSQMMTDSRLRNPVSAGFYGDFILCVPEIARQTVIVAGEQKRSAGF